MAMSLQEKTSLINETLDIIYLRRSVRKYKDKPVSKKQIEEILRAAMMAPSAINRQPWKFYVLTDKAMIQSFSKEIAKEAFKGFVGSGIKKIVQTAGQLLHFSKGFRFSALADPVFHEAPVVIFITAPRDQEWVQLDVGMCAQNLMLAAKSLGLDTCPVGLGKYVEDSPHYPDLKIPRGEQVLLSVILGYGDEEPEVHDRKNHKIVFVNR